MAQGRMRAAALAAALAVSPATGPGVACERWLCSPGHLRTGKSGSACPSQPQSGL